MKPKFPILPAVLWLVAAFCLYPHFQHAAENMSLRWPLALAFAHGVLFIVVFSWCALALERYFEDLELWRFEQRRRNPGFLS